MIRVLKASAGSGKTWNLAREYIRLLLSKKDPQAYRHILAVTFTNKATEEMKRRILDELSVLSSEPKESPYYKDFVPELFPTAEALQKRASGQLGGILHDYSSFAVSTIDKFFQQTLRAFSREIGQFASYQVELDKAALVEESVDRILDGLTEDDRVLLDWLTDNVKAGLESGSRFNLEPPLKDMAKNLKSMDHAEAVRRYGIDEDAAYAKGHLKEIRKGCTALADAFVKDVRNAAQAALDVLEKHGVDPADSNRGFLKALYGFRDLGPHDAVGMPTDSFLDKASDPSKWFAKSKDKYRLELEGSLEGPLNAFCALFGDRYRQYRTACLIGGQAYTLGIAAELRKAFDEVQKEKNVLSIEDSNTILKGIIDGSDAPFVYEKLGVRFEDFLLDEFQDTSTIQWENFRPLLLNSEAGGFDNLVVGDVKQSIYRWRGSDWHLLDSGVRRDFRLGPEAEKVLDGNFRTCKAIVEFNNLFFPYAAEQLDGLLGGDDVSRIYRDVRQQVCFKDPADGSVDVSFLEDYDAEMDEIVASVRNVLAAGGRYGDVAILVRGNQEGSEIAARLVSEGIPVVSDDSLFVKSSVTVRRLVSQLSLVDSPDTEEHASVAGFLARSMDIRIPDHYHSLTDLAESLLRDLRMADPDTFEAEVPYIQSFMDYLLEWSASRGNDLSAFLREWTDAEPKIASPETGSAVRVMTVHKSKGLEFPYVIFPFAEKVSLYKGSSCWCRPDVDGTPLAAFADGVYHVELSGTSESTLFAEDYHRERRLQFIDNINVFYVALTRAKYGLKVIAKAPPQKMLQAVRDKAPVDWKNLSQILYGFVGTLCYHAGTMYDFGSLERKDGPAMPLRTGYPSFPAGDRGRLRFSRDAADFFGPDGLVGPDASNRLRGLVLHDILAAVTVPEDLPQAVDRAIASGALPKADRDHTLRFLDAEISSVAERGWFSAGEGRILNEVSLIDTDGEELRPDRVIIRDDGSVAVVDYKFGKPEKKHRDQVARYAALYRAMGHPAVSATLWYVRETGEDEFVEV
ncbi:MAG: UvrD-helicase domain-containing protein [Bacteroidales bacterium]|nr:UvrD-helicase domain-containing protein [Bacteroidales bacterium]